MNYQKTQLMLDLVNLSSREEIVKALYALGSNTLSCTFLDLIDYSGFTESHLHLDHVTSQTIDNSVFSDPIYDTDVYKKIKAKIDLEFGKHQDYISTNIVKVKPIVENITEQLSFLTFRDISVELTPSNAIKFKIALDDEQLVTITKPFEELVDLKENQVVFNFYINHDRILSNVKELSQLVQGINELSN